MDQIARSWEARFSAEVLNQFEIDRRRLLAIVQEEKRAAIGSKATIGWQNILLGWESYLTIAGDRWREAFIPLLQGIMMDQGIEWNQAFGIQFDVANLFAEAWFHQYKLVFAVPIQETTSAVLHGMIADAQSEGWSIRDMERGLERTFHQWMTGDMKPDDPDWEFVKDRVPLYRREMIARTETLRASNAGSQALFTDWGMEMKEWVGTPDNRIRDTHIAAWSDYSEGGRPGPIPAGDPFLVGGDALMYPGDPSGSPGETINCRCTLLPYTQSFAGTPDEVERDRQLLNEEINRRFDEAAQEGG